METDGLPATIKQFTAVDGAADTDFLVAFVDALTAHPRVARCRDVALDAMRLQPGDAVVDLGCGTGDATVAIAPRVQPGGRVIGVDFSETMVAEATRRAAAHGLPVAFETGDSQALRFADDTFNACRTERMLVHVPDVTAAVGEMVRVTRPGGRVVAIDVDADGLLIDHPDQAFTRTFITSFSDSMQHGCIGRQLPRIFTGAGLTDVTVDITLIRFGFDVVRLVVGTHLPDLQASGAVDRDAAEAWRRDLIAADRAGALFFAMPFFVVAGTKSL